MSGGEGMRCAECDCENGGSDCNWIKTPTALEGAIETILFDRMTDNKLVGYTLEASRDIAKLFSGGTRATPKVKPLVWVDESFPNAFPDRMTAKMPCGSGDYSLAGSKERDEWYWYRNGYFVGRVGEMRANMTLFKAKAAAQADYTRRILSALETKTDT